MPMSADILTSEERECGAAEMAFILADGQTRLSHLYQRNPLRVLFPRAPAGDPVQAVLTTVSGGLVGGDRLQISAVLGAGARAMLLAQAAEKIYRSTGADCRIDIELRAADNCWLEWLPQETIFFDQARLKRQLTLRTAGTARFLAGEILVFGRRAMGETVGRGYLRDGWSIYRDNKLIWRDALLADEMTQILRHPACFDGAHAAATAVASDPGALDLARGLTPRPDLRVGASVVNGLLILRWLARDALVLRHSFAEFWCRYRAGHGLPDRMPRLWQI